VARLQGSLPHSAAARVLRVDGRERLAGERRRHARRRRPRSDLSRSPFSRGADQARRRDGQAAFYFVDRIGDTFRWKGQNVSTTEVAGAICRYPGIAEAVVYGVEIPGAEGRAGMAAIVASGPFDPAAFHTHVVSSLAHYARPLFVRVCAGLDATATFKHTTRALMREGYDPARIVDALYVNDDQRQAYVRLDASMYDRIQSGHFQGLRHALA
jgi:fatty-acyl-CoA synthase